MKTKKDTVFLSKKCNPHSLLYDLITKAEVPKYTNI